MISLVGWPKLVKFFFFSMDGSRDSGPGGRRTVTVLRKYYEKNAPRSEERRRRLPFVICFGAAADPFPLMATSAAEGAAAATGTAFPLAATERFSPQQRRPHLPVTRQAGNEHWRAIQLARPEV